jgi:hypothetical protein
VAKPERDYAVYCTDTDGSERKGCTVTAKSPGHAIKLARQQGVTKITEAVPVA